jgi:acyl-CoA reductase-like NAD-dependent aldehyde dehydrogenase
MIAIANESDYGLSAGVLTNDLRRGMTAARQNPLWVGACWGALVPV